MDRKGHARLLRWTRKIHRALGIALFSLFILIGITGILLGWKKNSNELLMPSTKSGRTTELSEWMPLSELAHIARTYYYIQDETLTIDRMDVRPDKGIVKVLFNEYNLEIQLDGATGEILSVGTRHSDWIEHLHDGSYFDDRLGTGFIKLAFTSITGTALLLFSITGFWLWYGPRAMRRDKHR
jgi:uncharacterized iron-regulated membrane protein